jgi:hypothetical protein
VIRKDPVTGEPNGVIEESTSLVGRLAPSLPWNSDWRPFARATSIIFQRCHHDSYCGRRWKRRPDLLKARERGWIHLRALAMLSGGNGEPMPLESAAKLSSIPDQVRVSGVKILHDGSLQGFTGYLSSPYATQRRAKPTIAVIPLDRGTGLWKWYRSITAPAIKSLFMATVTQPLTIFCTRIE